MGLLVFLGLIAINGLFAGAQFALVAVDRYEVESAAARGARRDRTVRRGLETLSFQLSGAQLGITVSSLILGFVVDNAIGPLLRPALAWIPGIENGTLVALTAALALVLATVIQMVLGELGPKNLAIARPMATARLFVPPAMFVNTVFSPVIRLLNAMANASMRAVGLVPREELEGFQSLEEMHEALRWAAHENTIEGIEYEVLDRALGLGRTTAGDVMVPRSQIVAVSSDANLADLARLSMDTGYSRFPISGRGWPRVRRHCPCKGRPGASRARPRRHPRVNQGAAGPGRAHGPRLALLAPRNASGPARHGHRP